FPLFDENGRLVGTACLYYRTPTVDGAPDWHGRLKPITEYVNAHYADNITIDGLAAMIGTSPVNFRRQFSRTFGISPGHYITTIRLNAVRRLLETTDKLVADIAMETGFWDQSHLTKLFKRERGMTPGEYRRRHRSV
ncbi:MAG: helix-turn-helix transcriptional regulator, partial [Kiritimatiellae bacterium]|nr:helix-turn-helix transcriptional regulator [Kiritimatiellia bacterium]